jgi:hypothetical protein
MTTREVYFYQHEEDTYQQTPYICGQEPIEYLCDGKEGYIHFNGYYYVENDPPPYNEDIYNQATRICRNNKWLPRKHIMNLIYNQGEKYIEELYVIEIYKKETHESTDTISYIEDGELIECLFFPTNYLTLHFNIISRFEDYLENALP